MKKIIPILLAFLVISPLAFSDLSDDLKDQAKIYREEGYKAQSRGDLDTAFAYYQKAAHLAPGYAELYNDLGVLYESMGRLKLAMEMYNRCLELKPGYIPVYTNLALVYDKQGDVHRAMEFWQKRYEYGTPGEYWTEKARERLVALGKYPEFKKERIEKEAMVLSRSLAYKREQERLQKVEEVNLHFEIGRKLFSKGDYAAAVEELGTALSIDHSDKELREKISTYYTKANRKYLKEKVRRHLQMASNFFEDDDYLATINELKRILSLIPNIPVQ